MRTPFGLVISACGLSVLFISCASHPQIAEVSTKKASGKLQAEQPKLGSHTFKVSTKSRDAQKSFDRGLTLAYSFSHRTAEAEFRKAAELDPELAMAWWGVALVNGPHINFPMVPPDNARKAWEAITKAQRLAPKATPIEQALIRALSTRYVQAQPQDRSGLDQAYAAAMRQVWHQFTESADAGALYAESMMDLRPWNLWTQDGKPRPGTEEIVETLEAVLRLNAKHPGANHYYIHTVEASPHPEEAVPAANRLRTLVPGASHMVHMPAHIYARVGRWDDAAECNIQAMKADTAYRAANPRPGFYALYMAHNAHFFTFAAMMQGRSTESIAHARQMVKDIPEEFLKQFGSVADGFMIFPAEVLMRFGKWDEVLAEPEPAADLPLSLALWHYTRASAFTAKNSMQDAEGEQGKFQEAAAKVPAGYTFGNNAASNVLAIAARHLQGEMEAKRGHIEPALTSLREAVQIEDTLRYDEPPDWIQPVRHTLGAVLMRAERPQEAEDVYREDLKRSPQNGWALYGLASALRSQGKPREAAEIEKQFAKEWSKADVRLTTTCFCQQ
jgi:tetratricopeptide (TPR) repeat protein